MSQFHAPLRPFIRRIRLETFIKSLFTALAVGVGTTLTAMLVMFIAGIRFHWLILGIFGGVSFVAALLVCNFLLYRVGEKEIIRRIDAAGLHDSVSMMLELWDDKSLIARLQREDAMKRIKAAKTKALSIGVPFIAAIALLAITLTTAVTALIPPRKSDVEVLGAIPDNYVPPRDIILEGLFDSVYETFQKDYEKLPETLRDELQDILDKIENITGSNMDKITELEKLKDYLDELLKKNNYGTLISDYLKQFDSLKALGIGISTYDDAKIHNALYAMCWNIPTQVLKIMSSATSKNVSADIKTYITTTLAGTTFVGSSSSFPNDRRLLNALIETIKTGYADVISPAGSIEKCLMNTTAFAQLGQVLVSGDEASIMAELDAIRAGCFQDGVIDMVYVADLAEQLNTALGATTDTEASGDAMRSAILRLSKELLDVPDSTIASEEAKTRLDEIFGNAELGIDGIIKGDFINAVSIRDSDTAYVVGITTELEDVYSGIAYARYLWNAKVNDSGAPIAWYYHPDGLEGGVVYDLYEAICVRGGIYEGYKESALINALYDLRNALKSAAAVAVRKDNSSFSNNYLTALVGDIDATQAGHETHKEPLAQLAKICNDIVAALEPEEVLEDVVGDIKDQIQDSIDDLLGKEDEEEPDTGIDVKPPENEGGMPSDNPESDSENNNDNQQQSPSGGGAQDSEQDFSGLTFFDPATGQQVELTRETLDAFKASIDKAIKDNVYTPEEQTQMYNYYNYLLQKFEETDQ